MERRIRLHGDIERGSVEGEGLGRLPSAKGLNEVGRAACALQPSGKSDAEGVPAIARGFLRAQTISKKGCEQLVGLRGHEWRSAVCGEEGSRFACTRLNRECKLEVSKRFRRVARHVDVGKGSGPATPDLARRIAFALARGDFALVACRKSFQLLRRE
eukprot:4499156-Pleurochrysis_carterae.AAC.1